MLQRRHTAKGRRNESCAAMVTLIEKLLVLEASLAYTPNRHVLILDCTPRNEPSEGDLLREFFNICKLYEPAKGSALHYKVKGKTDFLRKLNTDKKYDVIHISAHGGKNVIGSKSRWSVGPAEIRSTKHHANLVLVSACVANRKKMAEAFHSRYYLAPSSNIDWANTAMFALMFYKRYIIDGIGAHRAFLYAREHTKTTSDFPWYWEAE